MRLRIDNFGKIKSADISWDGLTVVTGRNDTGKSTVGKLFFAINKSLSEHKAIYIENLGSAIPVISTIVIKSCLRDPDCSNLFSDDVVQRMREFIGNTSLRDTNFLLLDDLRRIQVIELLEAVCDGLQRKKENRFEDVLRKLIEQMKEPIDDSVTFHYSVDRVMSDSFGERFNNSLHTEEEAKINFQLVDGIENICISSFKNQLKISPVEISDKNPFFQDITFIETPFIVDERFLKKEISSFNATDDLQRKLREIRSGRKELDVLGNLGDIRSVLGNATIDVDREKKAFIYKVSREGQPLPLMDVASGAKSWGLLSLLLQSNIVSPDAPLILDEPENHLHPEWQIAFAKFIAQLVEKGIRVLLTSHSPTFIHALIKSSLSDDGFVKGTHFYLAEDVGENFSVIRDVTNSTHKIFDDLSKPVERLWQEE